MRCVISWWHITLSTTQSKCAVVIATMVQDILQLACHLVLYLVRQDIRMMSGPSSACISIRYDDVPMFLRGSAFYKSLSTERDSVPIDIPRTSFKTDNTVNGVDDFKLLLHTMIFWGLDVIPDRC